MFINFSNIVSFVKTRLRQKPLESRCLSLFVAFLVALVFHSNTKFLCFKTVIDLYWAIFAPRAPKNHSSPSPPKKHADEITPQIWPTTFWKRRGFPSAWSSRSAAILRAPSQHPWMIESRLQQIFWGPLIKGKFKGGSPKKKLFGRSPGGMSSLFFRREGFLDRKHFFNFESQFLKRSMEKIEKKTTNYCTYRYKNHTKCWPKLKHR